MSVIQPMYFAAGKYSAGTVRKHLSSLFQSASDGTRIDGVIPAFDGTYSLKVVPNSGRNLFVKTGMCIISDKATQSLASQDVDQPGLYIAGVFDTDHAITIAPNTTFSPNRYDLVYAEVTETAFTVTNKERSGTLVTLQTGTTNHGFAANQTVVISGVGEDLDGEFTIVTSNTTASPYSFTYNTAASGTISSTAVTPYMQVGATKLTITNKQFTQSTNTARITTATHSLSVTEELITVQGLGDPFDGTFHISSFPSGTTIEYEVNRFPKPADVTSTAVSATSSTTAKARVPFAVKVLTGTTSTTPALPSSTNSIALARVTVANGASTISAGNISDRRVFATSLNGVYIYDSTSGATQPTLGEGALRYATDTNVLQYNDGSTWQTVSVLTLSGSGSSTTAAKSDHTHATDPIYLGVSQIVPEDVTNDAYIFPESSSSVSTTLAANSTYMYEGLVSFTTTGSAPYPSSIKYSLLGFESISYHTFSFTTFYQTAGDGLRRSGYHSSTDAGAIHDITEIASGGATGDMFIQFKGIIVTGADALTVTPTITGYFANTIQKSSYMKFENIGGSTVTTINSTWT